MSLMQCRGCPTKFVVGLLRCPRCGQMSELFAQPDEGEAMPKITAHGGPSNAADDTDDTEDLAPEVAVQEPEAELEADGVPVETEGDTEPEVVPEAAKVPEPDKATGDSPVRAAPAATLTAAQKAAAKKAAASKS